MGASKEMTIRHGAPSPDGLFAGRYRILSPIGKGGMGSVYLAEDLRLGGKLRALKFTRPPGEERDLFIAEARMLAGLEHPNLPRIVDYYPPDPDEACIVMDYIAGETLETVLARQAAGLPYPIVLGLMEQLCDTLRYLHAQEPPVVFRDLKPANVIVDGRGRAVLVDFGIARHYRPEARSDTLRLGTPWFAAPEQLRGGQSDVRTDLYGLGALAYHLFTGGDFAARRGRSDRIRRLRGAVPPLFAEWLERLLADNPQDRPASAAEARRDLAAFAAEAGEGSGGPQASRPRDGVRVCALVSAYPGAGATFAALGLSARLAELGASHALVEFPGGDPELYQWLDGERRMPGRAAFADPSGERPVRPAWREGAALYYPLHPRHASAARPEEAFAAWLRRLGTPIVLLDVSSRWEDEGASDWLARAADSILFVADCLPAKWSERRQQACQRLRAAAAARGAFTAWIANRDHPFAGRKEWLGLFPEKPAATLPLRPAESVVRAVWNGEPHNAAESESGVWDGLILRMFDPQDAAQSRVSF